MSLLKQLQETNNIVGSALGKSLAERILKGDLNLLSEIVKLIKFGDKNVRAGAAKTIEKVAEKKPELLSEYLKDLLPALNMPKPQTRWMIIHTLGLCAKLNPSLSSKAFEKAQTFLDENSGNILWDRTIIYLGYLGTVSKNQVKQILTLLEKALKNTNQTKTVLESFEILLPVLDNQAKKKILKYTEEYTNATKSSVKNKAIKLQKKLQKLI